MIGQTRSKPFGPRPVDRSSVTARAVKVSFETGKGEHLLVQDPDCIELGVIPSEHSGRGTLITSDREEIAAIARLSGNDRTSAYASDCGYQVTCTFGRRRDLVLPAVALLGLWEVAPSYPHSHSETAGRWGRK